MKENRNRKGTRNNIVAYCSILLLSYAECFTPRSLHRSSSLFFPVCSDDKSNVRLTLSRSTGYTAVLDRGGINLPLRTSRASLIALRSVVENNDSDLKSDIYLTKKSSTQQHDAEAEDESYDNELKQMKIEIEQMKKEAVKRIEMLSNEIGVQPTLTTLPLGTAQNGLSKTSAINDISSDVIEKDETRVDENIAISNSIENTISRNNIATSIKNRKKDLDLMDDTHWKIMLDIGRERGTWMPKTWGVSGDRLRAVFEINFTSEQLYDREEFLGSIGGSKKCHIRNDSITLSPSLTEGSRKVPIAKGVGGWKISKGEGPLGTDLLRFFIELDEQMSRPGSDVYCPRGRIYMQCGFFALNSRTDQNMKFGGRKEQLKRQLNEYTEKREDLSRRLDQEGFFSFEKLKLTRELIQLKMDITMAQAKLNDARVIEPDKSLLQLSKEGNIGLTREGGVVCKVFKGAVREYHILGKFAITSIDPPNDEIH